MTDATEDGGTKPPAEGATAEEEKQSEEGTAATELEDKTESDVIKTGEKDEEDQPDKTESVSLDIPVDPSDSADQAVDVPVESESAETVPPTDNEATDQPEDEGDKPPDTEPSTTD